jgi:hypothetical protein
VRKWRAALRSPDASLFVASDLWKALAPINLAQSCLPPLLWLGGPPSIADVTPIAASGKPKEAVRLVDGLKG